ncbi:hypothetical protein BSKO_08854 [Bryopsis sp. KO-2023]|nr:hypothetical protein BSKO_08854 [Bryopsis sp. KO-2023]
MEAQARLFAQEQALPSCPPQEQQATLTPLTPFPHTAGPYYHHQQQHSWPQANTHSFSRLARKEHDLTKRELELQRREHVLTMSDQMKRVKNWPRCRPILYHDIDVEIPDSSKGLIKMAYATWCLTAGGFCLNWLVICIMLIANFATVDLMDWHLATFATGTGIPLSFRMWYHRMYKRARDGQKLDSVGLVIHMSFGVAWAIWTVLSIPNYGDMGAGLFPLLKAFADDNTTLGLACFLNMVIWTLSAVFILCLLKGVRNMGTRQEAGVGVHYRSGRSAMNQLRFSFLSSSFFNRPSAPVADENQPPPQPHGGYSSVVPPVHNAGPAPYGNG